MNTGIRIEQQKNMLAKNLEGAAESLGHGAEEIRKLLATDIVDFTGLVETVQDALSAIRSANLGAMSKAESSLSKIDMIHHLMLDGGRDHEDP